MKFFFWPHRREMEGLLFCAGACYYLPMTILIIGMTIGLVGKVLLGLAVIRVHLRIAEEKRIDGDVISAIFHEKHITIASIILMVAGYILETVHFLYLAA